MAPFPIICIRINLINRHYCSWTLSHISVFLLLSYRLVPGSCSPEITHLPLLLLLSHTIRVKLNATLIQIRMSTCDTVYHCNWIGGCAVVAMNPIVVADQIAVPDKGPSTHVALVILASRMSPYVDSKLGLGSERHRTAIAAQRFFRDMGPSVMLKRCKRKLF